MRSKLCSNCAAKLYAESSVLNKHKELTGNWLRPERQILREYLQYLMSQLGTRYKPIWEAFWPVEDLFNNQEISAYASWDELESFRKNHNRVRVKAALWSYMEFLGATGKTSNRTEKQFEQ